MEEVERYHKVVIYFFSLTGNTLKIARVIKKVLERRGLIVKLRQIKKNITIEEADVYGVGTLVMYLDIPKIVRETLSKIPKGAKVFCFITHGGVPGTALYTMTKILKKNKCTVIGAEKFVGYDSWTPYLPFKLQWGRPNEYDLKKAEYFGLKIAKMVKQKKTSEEKVKLNKLLKIFYAFLRFVQKKLLIPKIKVNKKKCRKCLICVAKCPINAIKVVEGYPQIPESCERCYFCEKVCPSNAISCNWTLYRIVAAFYVPLLKIYWKRR